MSRLIGIALMVLVLYGLLVGNYETARSANNHLDLMRRLGFYGILTIGVGVLIISGGIDLSIGSLVGLSAVAFGTLVQGGMPAGLAALIVVAASSLIGLFHGLLVTRLRLQPFLVTLCGLFIYRGLARTISQKTVGLTIDPTLPGAAELQERANKLADVLVRGMPLGVPNVLLVMLVIAALTALVLHGTVYGRYLYAVGANEQAARYSGIATDRVKVAAYIFTAVISGLGGVLYLMEYSTANPTTAGSLFELYAITGAVLGGCALRGGEGTVPGMVLGAAVLPLLAKLCNFTPWIGSEQEYTVIGAALLAGTVANELIRRFTKAGR
ncbi:MAG TPA: ABC transporter permease [Gemmataceae bacterium]|jgi:ribose transport system permease protein|nr:ABC transporter permease [Gemmataceae bacterium]